MRSEDSDGRKGTTLAEGLGFGGASCLPLTDAQVARLSEPVADEQVDILPTGEIYVPQVQYRRLLNEIFGPGGWALLPMSTPEQLGNSLVWKLALYVQGHFVSLAYGEADFRPDNPRMSWASAAEAAKSSAVMRCAKDLGLASQCWDRRFIEEFRARHCVKVWRKSQSNPQWRRIDAEPFYDETGPANGKPAPASKPAVTEAKPFRSLRPVNPLPEPNAEPESDNFPWEEPGPPAGPAPSAKAEAVKEDPRCPSHGTPCKLVRAGTSARTGKAYREFWSCVDRECGFTTRAVSDAQLRRLFALLGEAGLTKEWLDEALTELGIESSKNLWTHQYDELCEAIQLNKEG